MPGKAENGSSPIAVWAIDLNKHVLFPPGASLMIVILIPTGLNCLKCFRRHLFESTFVFRNVSNLMIPHDCRPRDKHGARPAGIWPERVNTCQSWNRPKIFFGEGQHVRLLPILESSEEMLLTLRLFSFYGNNHYLRRLSATKLSNINKNVF